MSTSLAQGAVPGLAFDQAHEPASASRVVARRVVDGDPPPMADVSPRTALRAEWMSTVTVDADGRIAVRAAMRHLHAGGRFAVSADPRLGILAMSTDGPHVVSPKGMLRLPLAIRRACGISPGAKLLLVLVSEHDVLYALTEYAVTRWWASLVDEFANGAIDE